MNHTVQQRLLLFGASGQIGQAIQDQFISQGWDVQSVSRKESAELPASNQVYWNVLQEGQNDLPQSLRMAKSFDAVCWAQGMNLSDDIYHFNIDSHRFLYEVNVVYILQSLSELVKYDVLSAGARLSIISSIWQEITKPNKLSYSITKSALKGLILSLAADMASNGHLVNGVLPGVLDTPMTKANLTMEQICSVENATFFKRLPTVEDVARTVFFLSDKQNSGLTGQFIKVDLGFSDVRNI
jgi:NAD(P)-dependent dehydrogenase (short-subunit alcohol dehydrogenase family)